jgi:capsular exopolysaccharide synthesis family protein
MSFHGDPGEHSSAHQPLGKRNGGGGDTDAGLLSASAGAHGLPAHGPGGGATLWSDIRFWDYLHVLAHRRWTTVAVTGFAVLTALILTFAATPLYTATALVQIEPEGPNVVSFEDVQQSVTATQAYHDFYRTQYDILGSRQLALRTIEKLDLAKDPWLNGETRWSPVRTTRALVSGVFGETREDDRDQLALERRHDLLENFLEGLSVQPRRRSFLVEVNFSSPDPKQAARIAETITRQYVDLTLDQRVQAVSQGRNFIAKQLDITKARLEDSEQALQEFARGRNIFALEQEESVIHEKLADLNTRVTEAESQRIAAEALYEQSQGATRGSLPLIVNSPLLKSLLEQLAEAEAERAELADRFTPEFPRVRAMDARVHQIRSRVAEEEQRLYASVEADYRGSTEREAMLREQLERQRQVVAAYEEKAIDFKIMRREVDTNREIYENLLRRMKEVEVTEAIRASNITVLDAPEVPLEPSSPKLALNLALALILGLLGGVGLSFFQEYVDDSIRTPDEVERYLRLPMLGAVPELRAKGERADQATSPDLEVTLRPTSSGAEAIRTLRASLFLAAPGGVPSRLLITSAQPGEGKTCMAVNLAAALAQTGRRIVVVDCDLRRPRVHKAIGASQSPGVTNFLAGNADLASVVQSTPQIGLDFIPAGPIPPNPVDLLDSASMDELMRQLEDRYDHIVVDAPPSLGFADVPVLSNRLGGGCLLVTKCGVTSRRVARQACDYLIRMQSKLLGVVLNRIGGRASSYSYYQYYGYYGSYEDEHAERTHPRRGDRLERVA